MSYAMYHPLLMVTLSPTRQEEDVLQPKLEDELAGVVQRLRQLLQDFVVQPVTPKAMFDLERQLQQELRECGRRSVEWALNHIEPATPPALPQHVLFEASPYTRLRRKTPQDVATLFGTVRCYRVGYRPTNKTGDPTIFPLAQQLGLVQGATPALAERVAHYQAETGATQRQTS